MLPTAELARYCELIAALFYDLLSEKQIRIPTQNEKRERDLLALIKKNKRPVALFVDEAHNLNGHTLTGLKRLMELVEEGGGRFSVILAGHPKLRNDLRRPTMEKIGYRTDIFSLEGVTGSQREYIHWLLDTCREAEQRGGTVMSEAAIDLLVSKLRTPLRIQQHLALALEAGCLTGEQPISAELVETLLSRHIDDLEPTLMRHGYKIKDLADQFDVQPSEIRAFLSNSLEAGRTVFDVRSLQITVRLRHKCLQPLFLLGICVKVPVIQPLFESLAHLGPVVIGHGEPIGIPVTPLGHQRFKKSPFIFEAETLCGLPGRFIQAIAFPFATAVTQLVEGVAQHQVNRFGGTGALFHQR